MIKYYGFISIRDLPEIDPRSIFVISEGSAEKQTKHATSRDKRRKIVLNVDKQFAQGRRVSKFSLQIGHALRGGGGGRQHLNGPAILCT